MEWSMRNIFNASEEIATMAEYQNIRMYYVYQMASDVPKEDIYWVHLHLPHILFHQN